MTILWMLQTCRTWIPAFTCSKSCKGVSEVRTAVQSLLSLILGPQPASSFHRTLADLHFITCSWQQYFQSSQTRQRESGPLNVIHIFPLLLLFTSVFFPEYTSHERNPKEFFLFPMFPS